MFLPDVYHRDGGDNQCLLRPRLICQLVEAKGVAGGFEMARLD